MECSDQKPNAITLLAVLGACTHGGFVDEGLRIFNKFDVYGVAAAVEHSGCLVDLLACAGRLREAYEIVKNMLVQPNEVIWCSLLGACRVHGDAEMSELVSSEIHQLHSCRVSTNDAEYILLSNIMASSERWEQAERMRRKMALHGVGKTPGCSSVELDVPEQQIKGAIKELGRLQQGAVQLILTFLNTKYTQAVVHVAPRWGLNTHAAKIPFLGDTPGLFYYIGDLKPQAQQFILLNFFFNKKVVLRLENDNGSCCKVALFSVDYSLRECYGTSSRHASPCCREPKRRYSLLKISSMESNMRYLFMFHALQNVHTDGSEEFEPNDLDQQSIDELMAENNLKKLTFARKDFKTEDDSVCRTSLPPPSASTPPPTSPPSSSHMGIGSHTAEVIDNKECDTAGGEGRMLHPYHRLPVGSLLPLHPLDLVEGRAPLPPATPPRVPSPTASPSAGSGRVVGTTATRLLPATVTTIIREW
uniref:Pentatricopeptide repeat-containing protein n=1 Tax=Oryza rufipogon TaxID=4529 RepID=A0A0E0R848_ORYRU